MSEIGTTFLGRRMRSFRSSPEFDGFSKVVIIVSDEIEYSAGTDSGRTLRLTNPWGTPEMAQNILNSIRGFQYRPYTAEGAILDPAAELGDGVTANNVYGGIYSQKIKFGSMLTATVAAPEDEEINHEYPFKSKPNKEITREAKMLRAEMRIQAGQIAMEVSDRKTAVEELTAQLQIQAGLIAAKVSKTGGDGSTFEWEMANSYMLWRANGSKIFNLDKNGAEVYGKIVARSGKIGGFDILENYLSYNNQTWGGTNRTGIYTGPQGIQCGSAETGVQITNNGYLYAEYGEFRGSVRAKSIQYGGDDGYLSGSGISSGSIYGNRMVANTISTAYTSTGINASLGRGDAAYNICTGISTARKMIMQELQATSKASVKSLFIGGYSVKAKSASFKDQAGNTVNINYWGW